MLNRVHYGIVTIIAFILGLLSVTAQPPQLIPYQAIARDNAGNPVLNQNIGLRFSIHDQTISGTVVWQESQTVVSNNLGIIVTALGGTTQLTSVNWGSGAKFLQVEMDISGGTNYLDMGTQQMMSVPYALYAETSGSVINNGGGGNGSFSHWIGELYGGGIICHLWKDQSGVEHGLIASLIDLNPGWGDNCPSNVCGSPWGLMDVNVINSEDRFDGLSNTNAILAYNPESNSAVALCANFENQGFSDWYLPSLYEFEMLLQNRLVVNSILASNNFETIGMHEWVESGEYGSNSGINTYWTSSERGANSVFCLITEPINSAATHEIQSAVKSELKGVRAFRKF